MSGLVLVFDLDDTLYPERQFALSGFAAAGRWAEAELGIAGLAADMTRLLDGGHLGELFRIALAERLPDHQPGASGRPARGLPRPRAGAGAVRRRQLGARPFRRPGEARADHRRHAPRAGQEGGCAGHRAALPGDRLYACAGRSRVLQAAPQSYESDRAGARREGDRLVYVGDNPSKDFVVPNARGWTSIMVERPEVAAHPRRRRGGGRRRTAAHDRLAHRAAGRCFGALTSSAAPRNHAHLPFVERARPV